jgi:hypothetical protein
MGNFGPMNRDAWHACVKRSWWNIRCNIYFIFYDMLKDCTSVIVGVRLRRFSRLEGDGSKGKIL